MEKLSLVLADGDKEYLSKLERFLIVNYSQRFEIISFASRENLYAYLGSMEEAHILLINNEMLNDGPINVKCGKPIVLVGDGVSSVPAGYDTVRKYQHADRLVAEVLRLYTSAEPSGCSAPGRHRTRIVCVCSPSGGTGKSSIAAGCSILYESRGLRAFYLDLEAVPSADMFFHSDSEQSFSNVIFHLKGRNGNLGLKLEGASSMDFRTGVHFFRPPENILEMNELTEQDATLLLDTFRKAAAYDTVFIDTDCGLNPLNAAIICKSDVILLVLTPGQALSVKTREFINAMELIKARCKGPFGRIIAVLNKSADCKRAPADNDIPDGYGPMIRIDECPDSAPDGISSALTENTVFLAGIGGLSDYISSGSTTPAFMDGGGSIAS